MCIRDRTNLRGPASIAPYTFLAVPLIWGVTFLVLSVYDPKRIYKAIDELQIVAVATLSSALIFAGLLYLAQRDFPRWVFLLFLGLDLVFLTSWRVLARVLFRIGRMPAGERRVLIVGTGEVGQRVGQMIQEYRSMGLNLSGYLDEVPLNTDESDEFVMHVLGPLEDVREVVQTGRIDDVVIALPQRDLSLIHISEPTRPY